MSPSLQFLRRLLPAHAFVLALGAIAWPSAAHGQAASLVRDLAPGDIYGGHRVEPHTLYGMGPRLFFFSDFGYLSQNPETQQTGLWVSDGTAAGTQPLARVCSSDCRNRFLGSLGRVVFFIGGEDPYLLWRSDGTRAGTFALNESGPELNRIFIEDEDKYAFLGGFLFFFEKSNGQSQRLWRTNGTLAGTQLVADITPTAYPVGRRGGSLTPFRDRLYFLGSRKADGYPVVWRSDGTSAGTAPLTGAPAFSTLLAASDTKLFFDGNDTAQFANRQLWSFDGVGAPVKLTHLTSPALERTEWLAIASGRAVFIAQDGSAGQELWTSDGTAAGTHAMTDFASATPFEGGLSAGPRLLAAAGSRLIFAVGDGIWSSAGTPQSTARVHDRSATYPSSLTRVGSRVAFFSDSAAEGRALWSTDGTPAGTQLLKPICPQSTCSDPAVTRVGDQLYFAVTDNDFSLWQTDGTPAGTRQFGPLAEGSFLRFQVDLAGFDAGLAFSAFDAEGGLELWVKHGPNATDVRKLTEFSGPRSSYPSRLSTTGARAFFSASSEPDGSSVIWQSDGTAASTVPVPDIHGPAISPVAAAGKVFFFAGRALWRADGTPTGTIQLKALGPDEYVDSEEEPPLPYRSGIAFVVSSPSGSAIWTSDGTSAGTMEMAPPPPLPPNMAVDHLYVEGDDLFFTAFDRLQFVTKLWHLDAGTGQSQELARVPYQRNPEVTAVAGWFYFVGSSERAELWRTDGSAAGTGPVRAGGNAVSGDGIGELTNVDGQLFFTTHYPDRLWHSTEAGTAVVASFVFVGDLVALGSRLVFAADDGVHGRELWVSDGTAAGTRMLRDVRPGPERSWPQYLTPAPRRVFFTADDLVHGRELWQSDGTSAGTRLVQDIWPGPASSAPSQLAAADGRLFFAAHDGLTGNELWTLPFAATGACVSGETAMCLQGGRYRVEAYWHDFSGHSGQAHAVAMTSDSGYFWFFDAANVEVVLKVLDGSPLNGHAWVFFGSLSNVHYTVTVTDTVTLASRRYENPSGTLASVADTNAFGPRGAKAASLSSFSSVALPGSPGRSTRSIEGTANCTAGPTRLCLQQGRFAVDVAWRDFSNRTGVGQTLPLSTDTGGFWFFAPTNVELMVKVLDGRSLNGKFWVFFAALSTVEYTVTVTDTATGAQRVYVNPSGNLASVADTSAF